MLLGRENYNSYIRSEFPKYLTKLYNFILEPVKGTITSISVTEDDKLISYYVDNGLTCNFTFKIKYKIDGKVKPDFEITVPKLLTSVWIIKGGIRVPVTFLVSDYDIRTYSESFSFDYDRKLIYNSRMYQYKDPSNPFEFLEVPIDKIESVPKELRLLNDFQSTKLAIKLDEPTPKNGYIITEELCDRLIEKFTGVKDQYDDFILDKRVTSPHLSLEKHLTANRKELRSEMRKKLYRYNKLYAKDLQNKINRFFAMQSDSVMSVQNPASNNMINFSTVSAKLVLDKERTFFNESFADLIDVAKTPESVGNVNKNNELNVCTVVEEDGSFSIKCYDSKFNPIKVPYYKYYDSKVILEDSVDYIQHEVKHSFNYKYRGKRFLSSHLDSSYLIDAKPDDKLSLSTRNIPMVNHTDSVRAGSLGGNMVNQAIELLNPEVPNVHSGAEDGYDSPLNVRSNEEGEVTEIRDNRVYIGKHVIESNPIQSSNQLNITSVPTVKVGDKVKKGDVIFRPRILEDGIARLGINCYIGFMGYGDTFEDGVIVSSAVLDRFTHISIVDLTKYITEDEELKWIAEAGKLVKSKDTLISVERDLSDERFTNLSKFISNKRFNSSLLVPAGQQDAYISDVQIQYGSGVQSNEKSYLEGYKSHIDSNRTHLKSVFNNPYVDMRLTTEPDPNIADFKYRIVIRMLVINKLKVGDKLTSRYGGKGLVSKIIPESQMPIGPDGRRLELIMNPYAASARKIPSLLMEVYLGNIAEKLGDYLSDEDVKKRRQVLADISDPNIIRWSDDQVNQYYEKYRYSKFPMITGSFAKGIPQKINKYYEILGIPMEGIKLKDGYTNREIKTPIITGNLYLLKLRSLPEFSAKVTSDAMTDQYPVLGAKSRRGGQKIGEMEIWSYFANNMDQYLLDRRDPAAESDKYNFLSHLLLTGYDYVDDEGNNMASRKFSADLKIFKKYGEEN